MTTPGKRIALFMDGTWNTPESDTNVHRLFLATAELPGVQMKRYFPGVGTASWREYFTGGLFAVGMADIIQDVYESLAKHYEPNDQVYLFGFSRGGFETRALLGLLGTCGIRDKDSHITVQQLWGHYESVHKNASVRSLDQVLAVPAADHCKLTKMEMELLHHCKPIRVHFVGVFDVVAADPTSDQHKYGQDPTKVGRIAHAMALDEHRHSFQVMYCETPPARFIDHIDLSGIRDLPKDVPSSGHHEDKQAMHFVEQRWFPGVHSNVGGGFSKTDVLADIPRRWIQHSAAKEGLVFTESVALDGTEHVKDARQMDIDWKQTIMKLGHNHYRLVSGAESINETIDKTVFQRYQNKAMKYAPRNLIKWAESHGIDLDTMTPADVWAETGAPVLHVCGEKSKPVPPTASQ